MNKLKGLTKNDRLPGSAPAGAVNKEAEIETFVKGANAPIKPKKPAKKKRTAFRAVNMSMTPQDVKDIDKLIVSAQIAGVKRSHIARAGIIALKRVEAHEMREMLLLVKDIE